MPEPDRNREQLIAENAELRRAAALWRSVAENAPFFVAVVDRDETMQFLNRYQPGFTPETVLGKSVYAFLEPQCHAVVREALARVFCDGQSTSYESMGVLPDGGLAQYVTDVGAVIVDGQIVAATLMSQDVTARRRAEDALQKAHDELEQKVKERTAELAIFRRFVEAAAMGFAMTTLDGRIVYYNPAVCRWLGIENPDAAIGKHIKDFAAQGYCEKREQEILPAVLRDGAWQGEHRLFPRLAEPMAVLQNVFLIRDEQGQAAYLGAAISDISARRRAEAALERERQSLWKMLQASDHERQVISYEIHDGLAQYLAAARMQLQVFDATQASAPDEARKAYDAAVQLVAQAHTESRRLISTVRPPVIDEVGLETALSHLVHECRRQGGPHVEFDSDVQFKRLPAILENALYRIAQEALANACRHSKSARVKVSLLQVGDDLRLSIRDWGVGFDPQQVAEGHFGLEGIRQRVRLLGGRLTLRSDATFGTLLQVQAPIVEQPEGP